MFSLPEEIPFAFDNLGCESDVKSTRKKKKGRKEHLWWSFTLLIIIFNIQSFQSVKRSQMKRFLD